MALFERIAGAVKGMFGRMGAGAADRSLARVYEDNFDGLVVIGDDGRIIACSRVASRILLGEEGGDLAGLMAHEVLPEPMLKSVDQAFAEGSGAIPLPMALASIGDGRRETRLVQFVVTLSELGKGTSGLSRVVNVTFWDETERRRREDELAFMGSHDHLTGALTRTEFARLLDLRFESDAERAAGMSVMVVELNRFKAVNDALGKAQGDALLKQFVARLRAADVDLLARLGGASFAVAQPGRGAAEEMQAWCQDLLDRIVLPYKLGEQRAIVGVSLGITHTDVSGCDPDMLLGHAEVALTAAKALPGNAFVRFTPEMNRQLKERQALDIALRHARERGELTVTFQPQCSLETGELVGVEALMRWTHPEFGVVSPELFIPLAEENGEIVEIGRWVLQEACREAASWPFETRLAVNISPVQFDFTDIVAEVEQALSLSGLPAHRLDVEITEGILINNADYIIGALKRLRALGVGIALDDFGMGYSSLSYLGRLPVDKIKIDQSFVAKLPADPEAGAIIRAVLTLSDTLDKLVIAEGVENRDQAWMLRMMGCRMGQGYHFGRPLSGADMARWYDGKRGRRAAQSAVGNPSPLRES